MPGVSEFATGDARAAFVGMFVWCVVLKTNKQQKQNKNKSYQLKRPATTINKAQSLFLSRF